jgi:hypothetical protein
MKKALFCGAAALMAACGGGGKDAQSPGNCPDGTVLRGSDCVPPDAAGDTSGSSDDSAPRKHASRSSDDEGPGGGGAATSDTASGSGASSSGTPYDKDEVEAKMRRSAKQIKGNCGAATDDDGKATGPWGTVHATVTLGRNGHVKDVSVPDPYNGKPVGVCIQRQLMKLIYPPYAASGDVSIEWDFEVVKPK